VVAGPMTSTDGWIPIGETSVGPSSKPCGGGVEDSRWGRRVEVVGRGEWWQQWGGGQCLLLHPLEREGRDVWV
jgi:hypothetical protein